MQFFKASGNLRERDMGLRQLKLDIAQCSYQDSAVLSPFLNKEASLVQCLGLIPTPPKGGFWLFLPVRELFVWRRGFLEDLILTFWECFPFYLLTSYESVGMQCGLFCSTWYLSLHWLTLFGAAIVHSLPHCSTLVFLCVDPLQRSLYYLWTQGSFLLEYYAESFLWPLLSSK